jgi:ceramide glucosyltransferase
MIVDWLSYLFFWVACLGCVYLLIAAVLVIRFRGHPVRSDAEPLPVTILKPLHGEGPRVYACLASFCKQRYAAPVQIIFGVEDLADPAVSLVSRLQAEFPDRRIELEIDPHPHGGNRKVSNLANMARRAEHDMVILADSDIEVDADYLSRLAGALQQPGVGAVTCVYHGIPGRDAWTRLSALGINAQFLPNVVVGATCGIARPCFGATIAMRREMLARIGGLEQFAEALADDYAIGEAVRARGGNVAISPASVGHFCPDETAGELWAHEVRWARTIRSIDPLGHFGSVLSHPFPLALLGAMLGSTAGLAVAALALLCRLAVLKSVERRFSLGAQPYWLVPFRDLLSFAIFIWSLLGTGVSWSGRAFRVTPRGTLVRRTML